MSHDQKGGGHSNSSSEGDVGDVAMRVVGSSATESDYDSDAQSEKAMRWGGRSSEAATSRGASQVPPVPPSRTNNPPSIRPTLRTNCSSHNESHASQPRLNSSSSSSSTRTGSLLNTSYAGPFVTAADATATAVSIAVVPFGATVTLTPTVTVPTEEFKKYARAADMDPQAFLLMRVEVAGGALQVGEEEEETGPDGRKKTIRRELFSYRDLLRRHVSRQLGALNPAELEKHLIDSDFLKVFGVPKSEFKALPPHKKKSKKIAALLF